MAGRYDRINGAYCKVKKRYARISGAYTPVKKRFDKVNGVWVPSYSGAIEWTAAFTLDDSSGSTGVSYGNASTVTIFGETEDSAANCGIIVSGVYTFKEPFVMRAGQTITLNGGGGGIESMWVNDRTGEGFSYPATCAFASDTEVQRIFVQCVNCHEATERGGIYCYLEVTVHSDNGSFLLNNSGSSDQ